MKNTKVVHLGAVRDLLAELEVIRQHILKGKTSGWIGALRDEDGVDTVYVGGSFSHSTSERLGAVLKMSAARVEIEDGLTGTND
jgi:hypothetical protein